MLEGNSLVSWRPALPWCAPLLGPLFAFPLFKSAALPGPGTRGHSSTSHCSLLSAKKINQGSEQSLAEANQRLVKRGQDASLWLAVMCLTPIRRRLCRGSYRGMSTAPGSVAAIACAFLLPENYSVIVFFLPSLDAALSTLPSTR